jgi:hypothetical protein
MAAALKRMEEKIAAHRRTIEQLREMMDTRHCCVRWGYGKPGNKLAVFFGSSKVRFIQGI